MGFYNSLFGPGIGTVAIIAFTMIMHYDARCASGNGKVLIVLTNAIALVSYVKTGNVAYEIACPAALCALQETSSALIWRSGRARRSSNR